MSAVQDFYDRYDGGLGLQLDSNPNFPVVGIKEPARRKVRTRADLIIDDMYRWCRTYANDDFVPILVDRKDGILCSLPVGSSKTIDAYLAGYLFGSPELAVQFKLTYANYVMPNS